MATPPSQAKTKSSQAKTKKRRPAADDPPTQELVIRSSRSCASDDAAPRRPARVQYKLAERPRPAQFEWSGHGHGLWPGAEAGPGTGDFGAAAAAVSVQAASVKCAASLHTSVIVDGAAVAFGFSRRRRLAEPGPCRLNYRGSVRPGTSPWRAAGLHGRRRRGRRRARRQGGCLVYCRGNH